MSDLRFPNMELCTLDRSHLLFVIGDTEPESFTVRVSRLAMTSRQVGTAPGAR